MANAPIVTVQYQIPRVNIALPGRQNRTGTGQIRITPGMTEPFDFHFGNSDGVPLDLNGFTGRLLFWYDASADYDKLGQDLAQNVVLQKALQFDDPFSGHCLCLLNETDTNLLGRTGRSSLRWTILLTNAAGQIFPMQITASGGRFGQCQIERDGLPPSEIIRGLTTSKVDPA